ncbi:MAG: hypothetical protein L6R39_003661 [Caloplaca ligustica]|nr:MAG: hypothetical protein L6R39_003661 [Caloplaca ligustica]
MPNTDILSEEEEMKLFQEMVNLDPSLDLETTNIGSPEATAQPATTRRPSGNAFEIPNSVRDPVEPDDFAAFTATGLDLGTQKRVSFSDLLADTAEFPVELASYPEPNELTIPEQPYFGQAGYFGVLHNDEVYQTPATGNLDGLTDFFQSSAEDQDFWNKFLAGSSLSQFEVDQACQQVTDPPNDDWNILPVLDGNPAPEVSQLGLQPPPLPLHSKPNVGSNPGLLHPDLRPQAPAPVASMVPQLEPLFHSDSGSGPTAGEAAADEGYEGSASSALRRGRKRKAAPLDDSDDEAPPVADLDRRDAKVLECAAKMTYVQGAVQQIPPDQKLNSRTRAIAQVHVINRSYDPPIPSEDWSIYKYTRHCELEPGCFYSASEIHDYLYNHPLHILPSGVYDPQKGGLRIWIQRNPADSARRYPSTLSNRCRFQDCFATNRVVNQGHIRVCFDEQSGRVGNTNPFLHAAGYVHLNCLERLLDFPAICRDLPISPEHRKLPNEPRGRNRMMLCPDSLTHIAYAFIRDARNGALKDYPERGRPHQGSLTWLLLRQKVDEEAPKIMRQQAKRGEKGSHATVHLGDLEQEAKVRNKTRMAKYQERKKVAEPPQKKRKTRDESESESRSESEEEVTRLRKKKYSRRTRA